MRGRWFDGTGLARAAARLGDAVVDPAGWVPVMEDICASVGSCGALLLQGDVRTPDVPRTSGIHEAIDFYFREGWHQRDLRARGVPLLLQGRKVYTDEDITTPEEMQRSPFYNDCVRAAGLKAFAGVGLFAGSRLWVLALQRGVEQQPFEPRDLRALAGIADRLTAAATLSVIFGQQALSAATDALELVQQAALVLDRSGAVISINRAAEDMFDDDIRVRDLRLYVQDKSAASVLGALIDQMTASAGLPQIEPVTIRRRQNKPVIARVHPIPAAAQSPFLGARALVTLSSLAPKPPLSTSLLAGAFGLSPAEARLAAIMAGGIDLQTAAQELGVARDTARNQLKAIFVKTGAHRQSELVELLTKLQM
jgi:DNA-binding CsgD family transcriptional regulator/PAS domain-containing protein